MYGYALLECGAVVYEEHLDVFRSKKDVGAAATDLTEFLRGKALTLCAYQIDVHNELLEFGKGIHIDMGLLPAYSCKLFKNRHHLLHDVTSVGGDAGCALVLYDGKVVGLHLAVANTLIDDLDRAKEIDAQMNDFADSIASFAAGTAQLGVALLCHAFLEEI